MDALRIGCVSYLNAKPLIYGLERDAGLKLDLAVPSKLLEGLQAQRHDVALLPAIDYQRMPGLKIVPSGGIGSDGETLTVRIFSRIAPPEIKRLACDGDSHTSVALARILLMEQYDIHPAFVPLEEAGGSDAVLLIGDKVVCEEPQGYRHQMDLGGAWKDLTGLPFVFAVWMARGEIDLGDLPEKLDKAKHDGLAHIEEIVARYATPRGWPPEIARRYLTGHLKFNVGSRELDAMQLFYQLARKHGILSQLQPMRLY